MEFFCQYSVFSILKATAASSTWAPGTTDYLDVKIYDHSDHGTSKELLKSLLLMYNGLCGFGS